MNLKKNTNIPDYELFISNQDINAIHLADKIFDIYKNNVSQQDRKILDNDESSIVKGISVVNQGSGNEFTNRGGEFPSSLYSKPNIIQALGNVNESAILENRIVFFSGYYTCIGNIINEIFVPSKFLLKILEKGITFKLTKFLDITKTSYNPQTRTIHHPFNEHHFRLMKNNGILTSHSHVHHPITCERMYENFSYDSEKSFFADLSEKDVIDAYEEKKKEAVEDNNQEYISLEDLIINFDVTNNNRFITDNGYKKYDLASTKNVKLFLEKAKKILNNKKKIKSKAEDILDKELSTQLSEILSPSLIKKIKKQIIEEIN